MKKSALMIIASVFVLSGCGIRSQKGDGSGTIECIQVDVAAQVGGRLAQVPVKEGDALKKGDLVAQIEVTDYELKHAEALAGSERAKANLDMLTVGARDEDKQRAREDVRSAKAVTESAKADLARISAMRGEGSATEKQMDDARFAAERAAAQLASMEQVLARLEKGSRKEEIQVAKAEADVSAARLAQARKAMDDCSVTTPIDGIVTTKGKEAGEMTAPGSTIVTISALDEVWLSVYVPESMLGKVKTGQAAYIRIDGNNRLFEGKVTFVSPAAEFTPRNVQTRDERTRLVYRVKITVPNPEGIFKPGMPADGFLEKP